MNERAESAELQFMLTVEIATSPEQIAAAKEIRRLVFQVEQGVEPLLDFDQHDETSTHIIACLDQPIGTARIRCLDDKLAKIERLAVLPTGRGQGIGRKIMEEALAVVTKTDIQEVLIHAQEHLKEFYQQLGFHLEGETFKEAGIPHVKMKKTLS